MNFGWIVLSRSWAGLDINSFFLMIFFIDVAEVKAFRQSGFMILVDFGWEASI